MKNGRGLNKEEVERIADSLIGKSFGEYHNFNPSNKGGFGQVIEEGGFGYAPNSDSSPDFIDANIELKVTPYRRNKNGTYSAKERLVLNIINYMKEHEYTFLTSSFWKKNSNLLILFYLYRDFVPQEELIITHKLLLRFSKEDLAIIRHDWETIIKKIRAGLAHELSEADTMYLGACTKGVNKHTLREQPFSRIKAKQRAFSLKTTYMTQLVRELISGRKTQSLLNYQTLTKNGFEQSLENKLSVYYGKSQDQLKQIFGITSNAKNLNELLISKMLGASGKVSKTPEFIKANIVPKSIRIEQDGSIRESMSFPGFKYTEIVQETWDTSNFREYFETTKFMFIIFRDTVNGYTFNKVMFWNLPVKILDSEGKSVWQDTVKKIKSGNIIKSVSPKGIRKPHFLGSKDTDYFHLRPHARNANDEIPLPVQDRLTKKSSFTKYSFWLNKAYIEKLVK